MDVVCLEIFLDVFAHN